MILRHTEKESDGLSPPSWAAVDPTDAMGSVGWEGKGVGTRSLFKGPGFVDDGDDDADEGGVLVMTTQAIKYGGWGEGKERDEIELCGVGR